MGQISQARSNRICFAAGLLVVLFMGVPYLLLGEEAIVTCHDQLDGEVIAYLLQAKHLFRGDILPEFMNGVSKTALTLPAPACVLWFLGGNVTLALAGMQVMGSVCGYTGMVLLIKEAVQEPSLLPKQTVGKVSRRKGIFKKHSQETVVTLLAVMVGILYAYLPFLPVYGLTQYGIPLLVWCLLQATQGKHTKTAFAYVAFYAWNSSLVLAGFGVLGISLLAILIYTLWKRKAVTHPAEFTDGAVSLSGSRCTRKAAMRPVGQLWLLWLELLCCYIVENLRLLGQLAGVGAEVSHKSEYVLTPTPFLQTLWENLTRGGQHSGDYHALFCILLVLVVLAAVLCKTGHRAVRTIGISMALNVAFACVAAVWDSAAGIALRTRLGALGAFQMNRFLWLSPCFWYLSFGCGLVLAWRLICQNQRRIRSIGLLCGAVAGAILCVTGIRVLLAGNLKPNLQKLRNPDYAAMSIRDYYAIGVLEQVEEYLQQQTGKKQEEYRIVSLGIDPAAALYHGFYCLDGYSNNYPLSYKQNFQKIIEPELAKSEYLRDNFEKWGNRCYLFSAECPGYYTIEKNGFFFTDYTISTKDLQELAGAYPVYLLSAAYIQNAEESGLVLLWEKPFETPESYYRIFLYGCAG